MPEAQQIVRIAGKSINGDMPIRTGFKEIKGIGRNLSKSIATALINEEKELDMETTLGDLTDEQIEKAEEIIDNPKEYGIPSHLMNRRKDRETGEDKHLTGSTLDLQRKRDIGFMKSIQSYKGIRHKHGLRVRGQKTRTTGRSGLELGVEVDKKDLEK